MSAALASSPTIILVISYLITTAKYDIVTPPPQYKYNFTTFWLISPTQQMNLYYVFIAACNLVTLSSYLLKIKRST